MIFIVYFFAAIGFITCVAFFVAYYNLSKDSDLLDKKNKPSHNPHYYNLGRRS